MDEIVSMQPAMSDSSSLLSWFDITASQENCSHESFKSYIRIVQMKPIKGNVDRVVDAVRRGPHGTDATGD
jgi:hypothetical protein